MELSMGVPSNQGRARSASLEDCFAATDLEWRLTQIPDWACSRGVFFNMLDGQADLLGPGVQAEYRAFFRIHRFSPFRFYPTRDFLTRLVVLSQIGWGSQQIHAGMRMLMATAFDAYANTIVGRAALGIIQPDLKYVLRFMAFNWKSGGAVNYSEFRLLEEGPDRYRVSVNNEYVYLESAMVGGFEGTARLFGTPVDVHCELEGPFDAIVTLTPRRRVVT